MADASTVIDYCTAIFEIIISIFNNYWFYLLFVCIVITKGRNRVVPMLIITLHWSFIALSNAFNNYPTLYILRINGNSGENKKEISREDRWKNIDVYIISFNYLSQMIADWYPVYKIHRVIPGKRFTLIQALFCFVLNVAKFIPIIIFNNDYDECNPLESKCIESKFWITWSILQLLIIAITVIYYLPCWIIINKEERTNYETEGKNYSLVKKFRIFSIYRVRLQCILAIIAALFGIPTYFESMGILSFNLERLREIFCVFSYLMIYFDIILLTDFSREKSKDESINSQPYINPPYNKPPYANQPFINPQLSKSLEAGDSRMNESASVNNIEELLNQLQPSSRDSSLDNRNHYQKEVVINNYNNVTPPTDKTNLISNKNFNIGVPKNFSDDDDDDENLDGISKLKEILDYELPQIDYGNSRIQNIEKPPFMEININNNIFSNYDSKIMNSYDEYDLANNNKKDLDIPINKNNNNGGGNNNNNIINNNNINNNNNNNRKNENESLNKPYNNIARGNEHLILNKPFNDYLKSNNNNNRRNENESLSKPYNNNNNNGSNNRKNENESLNKPTNDDQRNENKNDDNKDKEIVRGKVSQITVIPQKQEVSTRNVDSFYEQNKISFSAKFTTSSFLMDNDSKRSSDNSKRGSDRPPMFNPFSSLNRNKHGSKNVSDASFLTESSISSFINNDFKNA